MYREVDRAQRWDEVEGLLTTLAEASPARKLYKLYLECITQFRAKSPGAHWDGICLFTCK